MRVPHTPTHTLVKHFVVVGRGVGRYVVVDVSEGYCLGVAMLLLLFLMFSLDSS